MFYKFKRAIIMKWKILSLSIINMLWILLQKVNMNYSWSQNNLSQPIDSQDSGIEMETQPMMQRNHQSSIRPSFASSSR